MGSRNLAAHIEKLSLHLVDCLAKVFKWAEFGVEGQGEKWIFFFFLQVSMQSNGKNLVVVNMSLVQRYGLKC